MQNPRKSRAVKMRAKCSGLDSSTGLTHPVTGVTGPGIFWWEIYIFPKVT